MTRVPKVLHSLFFTFALILYKFILLHKKSVSGKLPSSELLLENEWYAIVIIFYEENVNYYATSEGCLNFRVGRCLLLVWIVGREGIDGFLVSDPSDRRGPSGLVGVKPVELRDESRSQDMSSGNPLSLLWSVSLPVHQIL